jgi:hypothetical protein
MVSGKMFLVKEGKMKFLLELEFLVRVEGKRMWDKRNEEFEVEDREVEDHIDQEMVVEKAQEIHQKAREDILSRGGKIIREEAKLYLIKFVSIDYKIF